MDYDTIAAHFLIPNDSTPAAPSLPESAARRLRDAIEPIATIGWWSREAAAAVTGLGHDFFDAYVWGRAASLGADVAPSVVVAAFGSFDAAMLGAVYAHGRSLSSRDAVLAARAAGASAGLRAAAGGVDEATVALVADRLGAACAAVDVGFRPLFGALRALPLPDDVYGRAWRAAELVREHRGDGHLAAVTAAGVDTVEANVLTEVWLGYPVGEYSATRGLTPERLRAAAERLVARGWMTDDDTLTHAGRVARDAIEVATDESQRSLIDALGADLDAVTTAAEVVGAAVLAVHAAPADPRKRAAG